MSNAPFSPSAERNKQPILDVLRQVLAAKGAALEIASGTGQHAVWFAAALPGWTWQPTEANAAALRGIAARVTEAGLSNVLPPRLLDVMAPCWPVTDSTGSADATIAWTAPFDAVYCANMLHISPWATCDALMRGSVRQLAPTGLLLVYGPFLEDNVPTASGNLAFDKNLRQQDPVWGLRRLGDVTLAAQRAGLRLRERHAMPANNLLLVFARNA